MKYLFGTVLVAIMFITYITMPTFAYGFFGLPLLILISGAVLIFFMPTCKIAWSIGIIGVFVSILLPIASSWSFFFADKYHQQLENKTTIIKSNFSKDVSPVDISKVRIVDQSLALKLGTKILGENLALGSVVDVGKFNIQTVNGELYWVAPLLHSGFFKWLNSEQGTPGYVIVSATNENNVKLVLDKGNLKYQPGSFFNQDLHRHVYLSGFMTKGFTDFTFEIDDNGKPFWVLTRYKKTIGYLGSEATGTIIVNPSNGEINEYSIEDTPNWVDRIQPEKFVTNQLDNWGIFKEGWLNANFSKEGIMKTTPGTSLVYGNDGKAYWYTGMTSVGKDGSTIGFMLVNTRTKETDFYKVSGAKETKAMSSAEGIVQEKQYVATFPILYNVLGTPTYILTLKDKEGLVKNIAFVNVENYSIVGLGIDTKTALRNYRSRMLSNGSRINIDSQVELKKIEGIIERINSDTKGGNSYYYIKLKDNDKLFTLDSSLSEEIILTNKKDNVVVEFEDTEMKFISISKFENLNLNGDSNE